MHKIVCKRTKAIIKSFKNKKDAEEELKKLNDYSGLDNSNTAWKIESPQ